MIKNIAIAKMMGAIEEQWHPYNKDTHTTGIYLIFPSEIYKGHKWYPDNIRQHGDNTLKFDKDSNWQNEALLYIKSSGYNITIRLLKDTYRVKFILPRPRIGRIVIEGKDLRLTIFEALYKFTKSC